MPDAPTPDTLGYLILAFTAATLVLGGFIVSLSLRYRNFQQDIKTIQQLSDQ